MKLSAVLFYCSLLTVVESAGIDSNLTSAILEQEAISCILAENVSKRNEYHYSVQRKRNDSKPSKIFNKIKVAFISINFFLYLQFGRYQ